MLQRDRVDDQAVGARPIGDGADVRQVGFLRIAQVCDETAGSLNRGGPALEPKTLEAVRLQLIEQRAACGFGVEGPTVGVGHRQLQARQRGESLTRIFLAGHHDFARPEDGDFVHQCLKPFTAPILGR